MKSRVTLFLILVISITYNVFATSGNDIADKLKRASAVVFEVFYDKDNNALGMQLGTGFFIGEPAECKMVTAFHVLDDSNAPEGTVNTIIAVSYGYEPSDIFDENNPKNLTVIFPVKNKDKYFQIDVDNDLIVFDLKKILNVIPKEAFDYIKINNDLPRVTDYVATIGHTFGEIYFNFGEGMVTSYKKDYIITNIANVSHGNSGGPVVNNQGMVVGIMDAASKNGVSVQLAVPTTLLYPLVLKLESSSKGDEKSFDQYHSQMGFDNPIIKDKPKFKLIEGK